MWEDLRENLDLVMGFLDFDEENVFEWWFCDMGVKNNDFLGLICCGN